MKLKPALLTTALAVAYASTASAQVTILNKVVSGAISTVGTSQLAFSYTPVSPGSTLVFATYVDNGSTGTNVTFNTVAVAAADRINGGRSTLSFLRNAPSGVVNIVVSLSGNGNTNTGYVIYELAGIAPTGSVTLSTGNTITSASDTAFVISFGGVNNATVVGSAPTFGSIIPAANATVIDWNSGTGGGGLAYGYATAGLAGAQALGWTFPSGGGVGNVNIALPTGVNPDSDGDGLLDVWEMSKFGNLTAARGTQAQSPTLGANWDNDLDGFDNEAEETGNSDPNNAASIPGDIDGDAFADADEILYFGNLNQTPGGDYDGDYSTNQQEVTAGKSPTNANVWPDSDNDLMCDGWETANGLIVGVDDSAGHADADGFTNLEEFKAGTDPQNSAWSPKNAILAHRWSFNGNLNDSVGGSNAQILNTNVASTGFSSDATSGTDVHLYGGTKATSDYILLGNNLLRNLQSGGVKPVTIELWATQNAFGNWTRIWDFGSDVNGDPGANGSIRMTWLVGTDSKNDAVAWQGQFDTANSGQNNAPYVAGVPYHIMMTIVPAVFTNGALTRGTRVTWYSGPVNDSQSEGHPLNTAKGTFNTTADLRDLVNSVCYLGRSMYGDATANATYDEVRIWKGALTETERELFQLIGPDSIDRSDVDNGGLGDGFPDQWEIARFGNTTTAATGADTDGDGDTDDAEFAGESNPNDILSKLVDRDKDDLADTWEMQYFNNLLQLGTGDPDNDLVSNEDEEIYSTNPTDANSSPDTDGDGLPDGWELTRFGDLLTADSTLRPGGVNTNNDGDFDTDREEFLAGTNPTNRFSGRDTDADLLPDYWEYVYFEPSLHSSYLVLNGTNDPDLDTATNAEEFADGTDPSNASNFKDTNGDLIYDGTLLAATDGFGATSFNAGTNWTGALAPVANKNYLVPAGLRLRTPNVATTSVTFAGKTLALAGELGLKGDGSTFTASYVFAHGSATPGIISLVDAGGVATLAGTVKFQTGSVITAQNGSIALSALVSGSGALNLVGPNAIQFNNAANTYSGNITLGSTARLVVNGVLNPGTGSVLNFAPGLTGVGNTISGTGTIGLAGTMNINLGGVVPSTGATWNLVSTTTKNYDPAFVVTGFTPDGGAVGSRIWTDGTANYQFSESTGVLSFVGTITGFAAWAEGKGFTPTVNDHVTDNPDNDSFANILEYQLNGNPLGFEGNLVQTSADATYLIFTFQRYDLSESDSKLTFQWGTSLGTWNDVVIGATSATDINGVQVTVDEDLGAAGTNYDAITVKVPKILTSTGKLFGRLQGASQP